MVAGMTPCTVPWDYVPATMNAEYQIELAGKLHHFLGFCVSYADAGWQVVVITTPMALPQLFRKLNTIQSLAPISRSILST